MIVDEIIQGKLQEKKSNDTNEECLQIGAKIIMRSKKKISNKAKEMQRKKPFQVLRKNTVIEIKRREF